MPKELQEESKKRLIKSITTKMRTIMIGALAAIEEEIINDSDDIGLQNAYNTVRQRILDLGNTQIRNLNQEVDGYSIESNLYTVKFEVKKRTEGN